ncbi:helix-turn-helix domain-containing protein [Streptococcus equi]|uniref:Antitoxin PezA n=1 Tax=Streptococcus equi subsp. zooepidemicus TaxID=40041 RepID=A0AAX2LJ22_STRSZ|nr:helix-turn-helix transcriptional regulator [Streptococcus equi]HEQ2065268.1 helix-turn-helix transcriptional regulator [Streptococcus pyogenes]MCD3382383.1 helix-turn-helix domain-containing protein [Streptococcus equi subsp. zooepidemicus]MCD3397151.1 helix-turn-helix domain-containing protein [Streptococcus equi subsp. zooepidemicus]MCD3427190.1 helix-turn-helix domain-containing protein [Streptococcus equi subsp. zooepidemicus]MCD3436111.1 helix-turn-helix domain-containing protein [Stre
MPNRLKELRKEKGLTQAELAQVINTNQSQYGKYENGKTNLSLENAKILADYFGVSPAYLLGLETEFEPVESRETQFQMLVKDRKLSLREISEDTGINYSTIGNYNQGTRIPNARNAAILADYFRVSVGYLLGYEKEPNLIKAEPLILTKLIQELSFINDKKEEVLQEYLELAKKEQVILKQIKEII